MTAQAQSYQPKGTTLSSTSVKTAIPSLLRHGTLREYQHIGLDWLVSMYEHNLNGILADEMGLGKTVMTIALLGHLACQKGIWGPHLIVVPTSVMINWEVEFKRWLPGLKILCYYGSSKERKLKRAGWSKPNSFHVCITSYKLAVQDHRSFRRKNWHYLILDEGIPCSILHCSDLQRCKLGISRLNANSGLDTPADRRSFSFLVFQLKTSRTSNPRGGRFCSHSRANGGSLSLEHPFRITSWSSGRSCTSSCPTFSSRRRSSRRSSPSPWPT